MDFRWGIIILIIMCSALSTAVKRGENPKDKLIYSLPFFFASYYFVLSAVKWLLGYRRENLFESFWNAQAATILHYAVPLVIIAAAAPFLIYLVFRERKMEIIKYFDSSFFFAFSCSFLFTRKISNKIYCASYIAALIAALLAAAAKRTGSSALAGKDTLKDRLMRAGILTLYYLVTVVIYTPNELYLNNSEDFPMSYWYFFGKLIIAGIIAASLLMLGMAVYLIKEHFEIYTAFIFSLLTAGYLQGMFLNGSMEILDGTQVGGGLGFKEIFNLSLWIAFNGAVILLCLKKKAAKKIMNAVSIWIILIQLSSLAVIIVSSDTSPKSELILTTDGMLEVNEKNNIIVFILDKFDGRFCDEILEEDPEVFSPLNDFIYYENATSEFYPTGNSIPFLLTGTKFREDSKEGYKQYAYDGEILLTQMKSAGYDLGVYTDTVFVPDVMKDAISNYKEGVPRTCSTGGLFALMTQCSRYKMAPFIAKNYYMYDTSDIALLVESDRIANINDDLPFYRRLTKTGLSVSDSKSEGTFRFIHMHGAHPPYNMTDEFQHIEYDARRDEHWGNNASQTKGALKIVYEYIRQLKELGKYDDAMIIITADHGAAYSKETEEGNIIRPSCPILFVKNPKQTQENMVISSAPVSHADIIASIKKKIGVNVSDRGIEDIGENEDRVRISKVVMTENVEKYEVTGHVKDIKNWKLVEILGE